MAAISFRSVSSIYSSLGWRKSLLQFLPILATFFFVAAFINHIDAIELNNFGTFFGQTSALQWIGAIIATGVSFYAVGQYDGVIHRSLNTGVDPETAWKSGITAIALSQFVGLSLISGGLVRMKLIPGLTLVSALRLTTVVAVSFMSGWVVLCSVAFLSVPNTLPISRVLAVLPMIGLVGVCAASLWQPNFSLLGKQINWPPLRLIWKILVLCAADTLAAGLAFYMLLPVDLEIGFPALYLAYLLSLGGAIIMGIPGGIGVFELTIFAVFPDQSGVDLLAALLAFRLIYYVFPAFIGLGYVLRAKPGLRKISTPSVSPILNAPLLDPAQQHLAQSAPIAEFKLVRQGGKILIEDQNQHIAIMAKHAGQTLIALRDPAGDDRSKFSAEPFVLYSFSKNLNLSFYKCSAKTAVRLRAWGHKTLPITQDAWICPAAFTTNTRTRRQLRRKLRKAKSAGLVIFAASGSLPLVQMRRVSQEWVQRNGDERGFSMGRFCPNYIQTQRVYLGFADGRLVGFITLNTCANEWALDLMRSGYDAPDGIMHALVAAAIKDAKHHRIERFSLASAPFEAGRLPRALDRFPLKQIYTIAHQSKASGGLRQFKSTFAPNWQTQYLTASSYWAMGLAAFDIYREIHRKP